MGASAVKTKFQPKYQYVAVVVTATVMVLTFQNCGGFSVLGVNQEAAVSLSAISQTDASERALMQNVFGSPPVTTSADQNSTCQLIGDATLPLVTHYPNLGSKDVPPIHNLNQASEWMSGKPYVTLYDTSKFALPVVGNYLLNHYDLENYPPGVSDNQVRFNALLKQLCVNDLNSVRFIQGANEIKSAGDLTALVVENAPYFQILHSLVYKNNLFTLVIPPRWSKASSARLPTLFNGFYDLNVNFVGLEGPSMLETLAQAYVAKGKSGFAIFWNGNGGIGSRTVDNVAYGELNDFLRIYLSDLGASSSQFVSFGASRGGVTALNVASHPAVTAISVAFAYSSVPPYELDQVAGLVNPTIPALLFSSDWSVGLVGSWQNSFRHPSGFTRTGFDGLSGQEAHLKVLTGSSRNADAPSQYNALTPSKIAKLSRNQTQIFLETSSHDFIVPSSDQQRLIPDAIAAGLRLEGRVNYLYGHGHDNDARRAKLASVYGALIDATTIPSFVSTGTVSRFVASPKGVFQPLAASAAPLTLEVPRYIVDEADVVFVATGPANGRYLIAFQKGDEIAKIDLDLDTKGFANLRLAKSLFTSGDYRFFGAYTKDVGGNLREKIVVTSTATRGLVMSRVTGDIRAFVANASGTVIDGIIAQGRYFDNGVATGSNYGFLQTGTTVISSAELAILVPPKPTPSPTATPAPTATPTPTAAPTATPTATPTPTPRPTATPTPTPKPTATPTPTPSPTPALQCSYTHSTLGPIPVGGMISERLACLNIPAGAYYQILGTRDGVAFADTPLPMTSPMIENKFTNDGVTTSGVWVRRGQILNASGTVLIQTTPITVTLLKLAPTPTPTPTPSPTPVPAKFACKVTSGNLASFSMEGTILPGGSDLGKIGFYYVAGYDVVRKEWWSFDGTNWAKHNGTNATYLPISGVTAQPLQAAGINGPIFKNEDLTSFPNGEVYLGYGLGTTQMAAWDDLIKNNRYSLCATLPAK